MEFLPVSIDLKNQECLIIGGGEVAFRKAKHLLEAQAKITILAETFTDELLEFADAKRLTLIKASFVENFLDKQYLVIASTNNRNVNEDISIAAKRKGILINVVDDIDLSSVLMPAIIDHSPLLVAISTGGVSPVLCRIIKEKLEWILPSNLTNFLKKLEEFRPKLKKKYQSLKDKRSFSEWYIEGVLSEDINVNGSFEELIDRFENQYDKVGKVFLVGAGPGDPELLTIKALKTLQKADVVLHDALVSHSILKLIRKDAKLINVGKRANHHSKRQEEINELLVTYGSQNLTVVRLKGGDPFIYGRGGEELEALVKQQIPFEVIPGITAASGCASFSGIPLTHRDYSQTLMFITAHCKTSSQGLNWDGIARKNQTLVVYMGLLQNEVLMNQLISHGRAIDTPVAIIENGTSVKQRVILGQLSELPKMVEVNKVESPSLIIIGEVVKLAESLNWNKNNTFIKHHQSSIEPYLLKAAV